MKDRDIQRYIEYAHKPGNVWDRVERPLLDYIFSRFFKDRFNSMRGLPCTIETVFGSTIPEDFSAIDLGAATGRVSRRLIDYGVPPENIIAVDRERALLEDGHFPSLVSRMVGDIRHLDKVMEAKRAFSGKLPDINFAVANMVYHLMSYEDYVRSLKQLKKYMAEPSLLLVVVPHPFRDSIKSIRKYHDQEKIEEIAPWNSSTRLWKKTIQDYSRGFVEAGFNAFYAATTGEGLKLHDKFMLSDETIWWSIKSGNGGEPVHSFRLWYIAEPEPSWIYKLK